MVQPTTLCLTSSVAPWLNLFSSHFP
jgi:hypothetical protein